MEFFKKFKPGQEFNPTSKKINKKIEDQKDITIKGDVSIEDYTDMLNKQAIGGSESLDPSTPFEEMKLQDELLNKFERLSLAYNEVSKKLKEENDHAEMLTIRNRNATNNARKMALEATQPGGNPEGLSVVMDLATERVNKLMNQLQKATEEVTNRTEELKLIKQEIERIGGLLPRDEDEEPFDPTSN